MTLMRRPPNRSTVPLRSVLERLAGDWPSVASDGGIAEMLPALDVRETDDEYIIELDLPGIDPEQTEVLVEGRTVTIRGRIEEEAEENRGNYLVRERRQGSFLRAVALPGMIEVDKVATSYQDGQLRIVLPKASASRARRIAIDEGAGRRGTRSGDGRSGTESSSTGESRGERASSSQRESSTQRASSGQRESNRTRSTNGDKGSSRTRSSDASHAESGAQAGTASGGSAARASDTRSQQRTGG
jgi:HSP20 family protein